MEFGLHLPNTGALADSADLVAIGRRAEELGFSALWVSDRLLNPVTLRAESASGTRPRVMNPKARNYDALTTLAVVGGATSQIKLGTRVLLPVLRSPVVLARELGTLASLVGRGRMLLGVGAGWMFEEFEAVGVEPGERFARLEEAVSLVRTAWTDGVSSFDGLHYRYPEASFYPIPPDRIPIIIGGTSNGALRRAARLGDGWAMRAAAASPTLYQDVRETLERLRRYCDECDRDYDELMIVSGAALEWLHGGAGNAH